MGFFSNYENAGPGIPKAPQEKTDFFKFFEIYGRRFWKLMEINLMYFIFYLPLFLGMTILFKETISVNIKVVGIGALGIIFIASIGPATAGFTKVIRNYSQERNAFVLIDFFDTFKKCYRQSFIMGIIDVIFAVGFVVSVVSYSTWAQQNSVMYIPFIICLSCMLMFIMMHFYIYQLIVSTNLSLMQIIKNSFLLVGISVKRCLFNILIIAIIVFLILFFYPYSVFVVPFLPLSFGCFLICFNCYPFIRKYVIQPYYKARGEESPEFDYLKDDGETVFEDKGGTETPIKKQRKRSIK